MLEPVQTVFQLGKTVRLKFAGNSTGAIVKITIVDSSINALIVTRLIMAFTIVEHEGAVAVAVLALVMVPMEIAMLITTILTIKIKIAKRKTKKIRSSSIVV